MRRRKEKMMKKLLIFMMVLGMASVANAVLLISVDGVVDPPDTEIELFPTETVVIDIMGDNRNQPEAFALIVQGPGSIAGHSMLYPGTLADYQELEEFAAGAGMTPAEFLAALAGMGYPGASDMSYMNFADAVAPLDKLQGKLVDEIIFHCEAYGEVTLTLVDAATFTVVEDTQGIHQIPEPMTVLLLGLGGLFLRRRK
jgi:hypothetical protein